jgi:hypothetical protein
METGHTETVVEKAVAYVKDMFGIDDKAPDVEAKPEYVDTPTSEDAMRLDPDTFRRVGEHRVESARRADGVASDQAMWPDPDAYAFKSVGELNTTESARRTDLE